MSIQFKVLALSFKLQEDKVIRDWADERIEFQTYQYVRRSLVALTLGSISTELKESIKLQEDQVIRDYDEDGRIEFQTYQYARRLPATIAEETNGS